MNRKPFKKKEIIKAWLREPTVTKITGPVDAAGYREPQGYRDTTFPLFCKVGFWITN
jgi:hypothetical protein